MRLKLLAAIAVFTGAPALAAPMHYTLTIAGLPLGTLTVSAGEQRATYAANVSFETSGFAGLLDYSFVGATLGAIGAGPELAPVRFTSTSRSPRALRHTRIDWSEGAPALVAVEPPRDETVDPADASGALDPVSALVLLFGDTKASEACASETEIFDGSRLVRLAFGPPVKTQSGLVCEGAYKRLGGEPLTPIDPPECSFEVVYHRVSAERVSLEQVRIPTRFGQALISRTK